MEVNRESGQSLIQVLVAMGIMGILSAGFSQIIVQQNQEIRAAQEKLAALDFERSATVTLSDSTSCSNLIGSGNLVTQNSTTFDARNVSETRPYTINLKAVPGGGGNLAELGSPVSTLSNTLAVSPNAGIQMQMVSATSGRLNVNFDQTRLVRPLKNLSFPLVLASSGPASSTTITGCFSKGSGGAGVITSNLPGCPSFFTDHIYKGGSGPYRGPGDGLYTISACDSNGAIYVGPTDQQVTTYDSNNQPNTWRTVTYTMEFRADGTATGGGMRGSSSTFQSLVSSGAAF